MFCALSSTFFWFVFCFIFCPLPDNYIVFCSRNSKMAIFEYLDFFFLFFFAFFMCNERNKEFSLEIFPCLHVFGIFLLQFFLRQNRTKNLFHATKCFKRPNPVRKHSRLCICSSYLLANQSYLRMAKIVLAILLAAEQL